MKEEPLPKKKLVAEAQDCLPPPVYALQSRSIFSFIPLYSSVLGSHTHLSDTTPAQPRRTATTGIPARLFHGTPLEANGSSEHSTASTTDPITTMEKKPSSSKIRAHQKLFVSKSGRPLYFCISKEVQDGPALQLRIEVTKWKEKNNAFVSETWDELPSVPNMGRVPKQWYPCILL